MIEFNTLIGNHKLSGLENGVEDYKDSGYSYNHTRKYVLFILDGIKYKATENPDDGYRSYCDWLEITDTNISKEFKEKNVFCKMMNNSTYGEVNDVLEVYNIDNGKLIFSIGTENTDDYYPYFHFKYNEDNINY